MDKHTPTLPDRLVALAHSNKIIPVLLLLEILETTVVPYPYEAVFIALCLAAPKRIWLFVAITVLGSAIAGAVLYALGAGLLDPLADRLGVESAVDSYMVTFQERGAVLIFLGGLTPVPSYLVNLVSGASGYPFFSFLALFSVSRFIRFGVLGLVLHFFGERLTRKWGQIPVLWRRIIVVMFLGVVIAWSVSAAL